MCLECFWIPPKKSTEGDIDEGCAAAFVGLNISLGYWFLQPAHVSDLVIGGEERNIGHGEEGGVRVTHTLGPVQEVEFPEVLDLHVLIIMDVAPKSFLSLWATSLTWVGMSGSFRHLHT